LSDAGFAAHVVENQVRLELIPAHFFQIIG
jgi:hypothetical protein